MAVFVKFVAITRSRNTLRFPWGSPPGSQTVSLIPVAVALIEPLRAVYPFTLLQFFAT